MAEKKFQPLTPPKEAIEALLDGSTDLSDAWWQSLMTVYEEGQKMLADKKDGSIEVIVKVGEPVTVRGSWAIPIKTEPSARSGLTIVKNNSAS